MITVSKARLPRKLACSGRGVVIDFDTLTIYNSIKRRYREGTLYRLYLSAVRNCHGIFRTFPVPSGNTSPDLKRPARGIASRHMPGSFLLIGIPDTEYCTLPKK